MNYEMFPPEVLALQEEILEHPPLIQLLQQLETTEWTMRLACIAAYCEIILDGTYSETDIRILCDTLTQRLKEKRVLIIRTDQPRTLTVVPSLDPPSPDDPAEGGKIIIH